MIDSLQDRIASLKHDLTTVQKKGKVEGATVPTGLVNNYFNKLTQDKQDKDLEVASYEGVLYDLRRKERDLLNSYRTQ